jgi:cytochrome P450
MADPAAQLAWEFRPFELEEPFGFYARARAEEPVFYSPELDFWVVSRHEDVLAILRDGGAVFSSENAQAPFHPRPAAVEQVLGSALSSKSGLLAHQPPDHTRLRAFVNKAFSPRRVAVLEPQIRHLVAGMIECMAPRGRADLVAELAYELPALVVFILLGVPEADVAMVKRWAQSRLFLNFGNFTVEEQVGHAHNVVAFWRYCEELVEARFAEPADDLPSDLVRAYQVGDQSITREEIAGLVYSQLSAGHETTAALLAIGLFELLRERDRWQMLCADAALIPRAVEELLRFCTPTTLIKRRAKRQAQVAGVTIPEGANVLLLLGSANHDEAVFMDPEKLDLQRANAPKHLAFGQGMHFCLGAAVARLEAQVAFQELTTRLPEIRLVEPHNTAFLTNTSFRSPTSLLVEWPV